MEVDEEKCNSCGLCIDNCPFKCWKMEEGGVPELKDVYECFSCYNCIVACPLGAIEAAEPYHVDSGFYDGTIFHRVISGFMVQGGGFTQDFQQKKTHPPITNEASNGLKNERGTIAMARTNDPDSATCQFFINHKNNNFLNYAGPAKPGYAVFGKVTQGMDVVDAIANVKTSAGGPFPQDVPTQTVIIESAVLLSDQ